jgi:hypothetical protein
MDKVLLFISNNAPKYRNLFIELATFYFIPLIIEYNDQDIEDLFFERMDDILDEFIEKYPEIEE